MTLEKSPSGKTIILVTVSGRDAPGITSQITGVLAEGKATILDIGQAVIHHLLSLSILFELDEKQASEKPVVQDLLFMASSLGLHLDLKVMTPEWNQNQQFAPKAYYYALTLIADRISAQALHEVSAILAKRRVNIDSIKRLSEDGFSCVEMIVSCVSELDRHALKKELLSITQKQEVDIALQAEGLYRRSKRLVVFDVDSTLIQGEVINEFGRELGVYDEISAITRDALAGKMNYDESLRLRAEKLKGLSIESMEKVYGRIQFMPGADELIRVLKKLGYKTALISGGFTFICERIREKLGVDYAYANVLEMERGLATGKLLPPLVNAQRKADLLELIAQQERILMDQVIAIGDGANDLLMLERAGLGIAFNAKPVVKERADTSISRRNMKSILHLLGISGKDLSEVLSC